MSEQEKTELEQMAHAFWQDSLAKFFPTSKGPTNVEVAMFVAGHSAGYCDKEGVKETQDFLRKLLGYLDVVSEDDCLARHYIERAEHLLKMGEQEVPKR
jgi:hypothetical protein